MVGLDTALAGCQGASSLAQLGHHGEGKSRRAIELRLVYCGVVMRVFGGEWKPWTTVRARSFNGEIENDAMSYI
jgi:hypothetical protein